MSHQNSKTEKQKTKSLIDNQQAAGSEYHREHAGNVEGYGQPHPVNGVDNRTKNND
ncbi:hypothetical protein J7I93_18385 [Bacillus sp. ISL-47]|uniref:hypothetical protein n=1 Tax=Bacillus sp. ISL-47 TaxID=2819130 RepID=UPI001BE8E460|nr:hypothetical protein [Bacillus sp. ISL-47]MBT2690140.1 hypothetical protein [Bacillus sp. ISL-47]MBT2709145.1 hypothetical protein [Pseudomonas sp. ISL-84]